MFKNQIKEDIELIQEKYSTNNPLLKKDDYAFNFWVLSKMFNIDEEVADSNVTEYRDDGCDCFVFFEESKELYIIQNKYYSDSTKLDKKYVQNKFFNGGPLLALYNNNYNRSTELQEIFNKYKNNDDLKIYMHLYVTNNLRDEFLIDFVEKIQFKNYNLNCYVSAKLFYLDDIRQSYYGDRKEDSKSFEYTFLTKNKGTVLNINSNEYDLPNLVDAKFILTPVELVYDMVKSAKTQKYPLFDENIREYLGNKGVNASIAKTLENADERNNFFYYNNGITIICDSVNNNINPDPKLNRSIFITNPQIVNGCQTVNSIYEVLHKADESSIKKDFQNTFVMVKLLVLEKGDELYKKIVKYNNSQNAITEKHFAANKNIFINLQKEFKKRGFLLLVKPSDAHKFKKENFNDFRPLVQIYADRYNLIFDNISQISIPLEKLLQILLAFTDDGYSAFQKKSRVLKIGDPINVDLINFIESGRMTVDNLLNVYMLYLKALKDQQKSESKQEPIPYYVIGFIGNVFKHLEGDEYKNRLLYLFDENNFSIIYDFYFDISFRYRQNLKEARASEGKELEYNVMIKTQIDYNVLTKTLRNEIEMFKDKEGKKQVQRFING